MGHEICEEGREIRRPIERQDLWTWKNSGVREKEREKREKRGDSTGLGQIWRGKEGG